MRIALPKRPGLFLAAGLLATFAGARLVNYVWPRTHLIPGVHLHHYVYGIFILTAAGYLALQFKGPRATFWIGLLYAFGVGLTFDEFGFWFNPPFVRGMRWNRNGVFVIAAAFLVISLARLLIGRRRAARHQCPRD